MDSFEKIVALYLEDCGYWVKHNVKADISKKDKTRIGLSSMPRPEIDLVAYKPNKNELIFVEAKSYLDSPGVSYKDLTGKGRGVKRYKLFNNKKFRDIVTKQIIKDFKKDGLIFKKVKPVYALAVGKIKKGDGNKLQNYFNKKGWRIFTPEQISKFLKDMAEKKYENHQVVIAAKMILR
ncbi:MAG: hypothetical protein HYT36_02795 [Candidatus Staskawiczbacteria bacterium]|nr:hypothetical protein [Candidatus Staskawiczbacteria bacterium]